MATSIKTTAVFLRPFELPSFNETLPPGEYEIEAQTVDPGGAMFSETWDSSVLVSLHPRASHPGLSRSLRVPLADLEHAVAEDKLTGRALKDFFLEEMLADPMIRLVMQADDVSEAHLRHLYSEPRTSEAKTGQTMYDDPSMTDGVRGGVDAGISGPRFGSARPGIGE